MTYEGRTWREGRFWAVEVRGVGVTQARRLSQVEEMARDLVAIMVRVPADTIHVEIRIELNEGVKAEVEEAKRLRTEAARLQEAATHASRAAAAHLRETGLSINDVGTLLGISYQRVHQLLTGR
jgi:hypothetical protein